MRSNNNQWNKEDLLKQNKTLAEGYAIGMTEKYAQIWLVFGVTKDERQIVLNTPDLSKKQIIQFLEEVISGMKEQYRQQN